MKEIRCVYESGGEKRLPYCKYKTYVEKLLEGIKNKRGTRYIMVMESPLMKVYVDGMLVFDKGLIE